MFEGRSDSGWLWSQTAFETGVVGGIGGHDCPRFFFSGDALALQGLRAFGWRDPAHSYSLRDICSPGMVTA